jgi:hypothetical protein
MQLLFMLRQREFIARFGGAAIWSLAALFD